MISPQETYHPQYCLQTLYEEALHHAQDDGEGKAIMAVSGAGIRGNERDGAEASCDDEQEDERKVRGTGEVERGSVHDRGVGRET